MNRNNQWRNYFLIAIAISTHLVAVCALVLSTVGNRTVANFEFPQRLQLNSSSIFTSLDFPHTIESSLEPTDKEEIVKAQQKYQYISKKPAISLEMSYLVNTRGNVPAYLQKYTEIAPEAIDKKQVGHIETVGHHAFFTYGDRAYLSSCISPRSLASVSPKQFSQYRYQNDLKLSVGWNWLQGKASIRDRRCLWVNLSTPVISDSQTAYQSLEVVWQDLYRWWMSNFPPL